MTFDEQIEVLQAAKAGKKLQYRYRVYAGAKRNEWADFPADASPIQSADICFSEYDYRVKPEPRHFWLVLGPAGEKHPFVLLDDAKRFVIQADFNPELVHVVEVID